MAVADDVWIQSLLHSTNSTGLSPKTPPQVSPYLTISWGSQGVALALGQCPFSMVSARDILVGILNATADIS